MAGETLVQAIDGPCDKAAGVLLSCSSADMLGSTNAQAVDKDMGKGQTSVGYVNQSANLHYQQIIAEAVRKKGQNIFDVEAHFYRLLAVNCADKQVMAEAFAKEIPEEDSQQGKPS